MLSARISPAEHSRERELSGFRWLVGRDPMTWNPPECPVTAFELTQNTESSGHHGCALWRYNGQTCSSEFSAVWAYNPLEQHRHRLPDIPEPPPYPLDDLPGSSSEPL
jgi:hypothetical protein